jgi:hypothetical protein
MRQGNFITNEYMSLTALNAAFDMKTGKRYDITKLEEPKSLMQKSLDASDKIIEYNLIDDLKEYLKQNKQ